VLTRRLIALVLLVGLLVPATALAVVQPRGASDTGPVLDTPATPAPDDGPRRPRASRAPEAEATPVPRAPDQPPDAVPGRPAITVGYTGDGILAQAPLLLALAAGYFEDAGFEHVDVVRVGDPLDGLLPGDLEFGVTDARAAAAAVARQPGLQAVAGYRNQPADGDYEGDLIVAAPGLVENEPGTVLAFLGAYIRALQALADADSDAVDVLEGTDVAVDPEVAADWAAALSVYAPFDGGFGDVEDDGGLGQLAAYLTDEEGTEPDLDALIAEHTLAIAQLGAGLAPNPLNDLAGPPGITDLSVGQSGAVDGPIARALEAGYFEDAGFDSVEVVDVGEPLLGVLQGELQLGVMDSLDAADGSAQGLPLLALAGHHNYSSDGAYGGDVVVSSADSVAQEASTLSAFLIAYVRALRDLAPDDAGEFAPFDGGFGARDQGGGLGELGTYLESGLGSDVDLDTLIDERVLQYAQAWWGLPANPTAEAGAVAGASAAPEEDG